MGGVALALYFVLLPVVVATQWRRAAHETHGPAIRILLIALALFWLGFLLQFARALWRQGRGEHSGPGASAWLAALVLSGAALASPSHLAARHGPAVVPSTGAVVLALAARRRADEVRRGDYRPGDDVEVQEVIEELRAQDPLVLSELRALIGADREGEVLVGATGTMPPSPGPADPRPLVAVAVAHEGALTRVAFAGEGGRLRLPAGWDLEQTRGRLTGLHPGGRVEVVDDPSELLRALATRSLRRSAVVYCGPTGALDDELLACTILLEVPHGGPAPVDAVRVELLRADPRVVGLVEPFTPTLRRRCVEMAAYLALHRHEPVTGERLRARVLGRGETDASTRTLANVASSLRRSLGVDEAGPRLHPVSALGLYTTHGLTSDLAEFSALVSRARRLEADEAAPLLSEALSLVRGEPLASVLRGYEWFLAEGHAARLQRDGEWAALALHHWALDVGDWEVAYDALATGRLLDPYSDALAEAQALVPRLREFGGDRAGVTQDHPVGPGRAVAARRTGDGFTGQRVE